MFRTALQPTLRSKSAKNNFLLSNVQVVSREQRQSIKSLGTKLRGASIKRILSISKSINTPVVNRWIVTTWSYGVIIAILHSSRRYNFFTSRTGNTRNLPNDLLYGKHLSHAINTPFLTMTCLYQVHNLLILCSKASVNIALHLLFSIFTQYLWSIYRNCTRSVA